MNAFLCLDCFVCKLRYVFAVAGQIVGVIVLDERVNQESANLLNVESSSHSSARSMAEVEGIPRPAIIAQIILVRLTLAWLTGIILLIATILGVRYHIISHLPLLLMNYRADSPPNLVLNLTSEVPCQRVFGS